MNTKLIATSDSELAWVKLGILARSGIIEYRAGKELAKGIKTKGGLRYA